MSKNLRRLAVCTNDWKNELLMTRILLNVINIFMFWIMQSLKRNLLKNIMMTYCQNILNFKKL